MLLDVNKLKWAIDLIDQWQPIMSIYLIQSSKQMNRLWMGFYMNGSLFGVEWDIHGVVCAGLHGVTFMLGFGWASRRREFVLDFGWAHRQR